MSHQDHHDRPSRDGHKDPSRPARWHRTRTVREREQVSVNALARRMKVKESLVAQLEDEGFDMPLSMLYRLAEALKVPLDELLLTTNDAISAPIRERAHLLRIARTAHTILSKTRERETRFLAQSLVDQLVDLMPELAQAGTWPEVGKRRSPTDVPRMEERIYSVLPALLRDSATDWWDATSAHDI